MPGPGKRFDPACNGGPGRPPRQTERRYQQILTDAVTEEDWRMIVRRAVEDA